MYNEVLGIDNMNDLVRVEAFLKENHIQYRKADPTMLTVLTEAKEHLENGYELFDLHGDKVTPTDSMVDSLVYDLFLEEDTTDTVIRNWAKDEGMCAQYKF